MIEQASGVAAKRREFLRRLSGFAPSEAGGPEIVALDYPGADLYLYVTSRAEKKSRRLSCAKEPWTVAWLEQALRPGDVLYDIGANVGAYTLIAARRVSPGGQVFAFEPGYASFAHLCDNIVLNGCEDAVTPMPFPLASSTGLIRFAYHKLYPGNARHRGLEAGSMTERSRPVYEQPAAAMRLDDAVRTFGMPPPRHMKLDVDGAEVAVLEGAAATLAHPALCSVLVEVDTVNTTGVINAMRRAGLTLTARHERTEQGAGLPFWYGAFERR